MSLSASPSLQNSSVVVFLIFIFTKSNGLNMNVDIKIGGRKSTAGFSKADKVPLY